MELSNEQEILLKEQLSALREQQKAQGEKIKALKKDKVERAILMPEVEALNAIKAQVADVLKQLYPPNKLDINRTNLEELLKRRFFISQSFAIHGGAAGLFDFGPPGCSVKENLLAYWRQFFVLEESMLQVETTCLTPEKVLRTSGHTEKFLDVMVRDEETKMCYRADHLIENYLDALIQKESTSDADRDEARRVLAAVPEFKHRELNETIAKYKIKAPETGNDLSESFDFNLMFKTQIGPYGNHIGYFRPETAQGIFVNFKQLLDYNYGKAPFAAACIGLAFRNEIAPRNGLLRVREFTLAEIEHFTHPDRKTHAKIDSVKDIKLDLISREAQRMDPVRLKKYTIGEALEQGIIGNETMAYYLGRIHLFLVNVGINRFRFRQHRADEMAHYANDCWDAEILTSYGWVEVVGCADRSCYDLNVHAAATNQKLSIFEEFPDGPRVEKYLDAKLNKKTIGGSFKKDAAHVFRHFAGLSAEDLAAAEQELKDTGKIVINADDKTFEVVESMVTFAEKERKIAGYSYTPSVIEPSFGIGRLIYCIFEHSYNVRPDDEQRGFLSFTPVIAPVKASVLPLTNDDSLKPFTADISKRLKEANLPHKVDDVGHTIGRRYARTDEIGIPFGITIDFDTPKTNTVTLRDRDSTEQVRVPIDELCNLLKELLAFDKNWADVEAKYEKVAVE